MSKLQDVALAGMFTFFIISILAASFYSGSDDPTKENFTLYQEKKNWSELDDSNLSTIDNSGNVVSNMQLQSEVIANKIGEASVNLQSDDIGNQLAGAFGIISAVTIDIVFLLLFILLDGVNFIGGVGVNLTMLPTPFNYFGMIVGLAIGLFTVFVVFKIIAVLLKWDA